jgi:hypothetical protein
LAGLFEDLFEQTIFASAGNFSELADEQFQKPGGRQMGQMEVDRLSLGPCN